MSPSSPIFVRFVTGAEDENAYRLKGIFTAAYLLRHKREFHDYESDWLEEIFEWFNQNLPTPPFEEKLRSSRWTANAKCWFRNDADECIQRIWDLVALLREHEVAVRLVKAKTIGKVVYEDEFQIVAETPYWA